MQSFVFGIGFVTLFLHLLELSENPILRLGLVEKNGHVRDMT